MKKNGIQFKLKQQKFPQGACCCICGQKINRGQTEYLSQCTPYMHLCKVCAISNKNLPNKKGISIKINNRLYMWVSKGIRGNHKCELTQTQIKSGTPCWWSSTRDDPEGKNQSYISSIQMISNPNEYYEGQKTQLCKFQNELVTEDNKIYIEQKKDLSQKILRIKTVLNKKKEQNWWDQNYKPIKQKHLQEDVELFFRQVYGQDYLTREDIRIYSKESDKPYISLKEYINDILIKDGIKRYYIYWQDLTTDKNATLYITTNQKIQRQIKYIGLQNAQKPIKEIELKIQDYICQRYQKIKNKWLRRD